MKKNNNPDIIDASNVNKYSTEDREVVLEKAVKNSAGFPVVWPIKNGYGQRILLSFVNATIHDKNGYQVDDEIGNFDILEKDVFDKNDEKALVKVKFLSALFSSQRLVNGGIYYKGEYYTHKMTIKFAKYLTKCFMHTYFHIEDAPLILDYFERMQGTGLLPYWPINSYDGKIVEISAVNAYIVPAGTDVTNVPEKKINFNITKDETFDLTNSQDLEKASVIHSLLDSNQTVMGFYYNGKLLPEVLSKKIKRYFEAGFVTHNFTVDQKDYLFNTVSKDEATGYPLFWPKKNSDGKKIAISVVNASVSALGLEEEYANFDIFSREDFDLTVEANQKKLQVVQALFTKKPGVTGALYFEGHLIPGELKKAEILIKKDAVEKHCKIYISDNDDFIYVTKNYKIEDRFKILRLSGYYDAYYPDNTNFWGKVSNKLVDYNKETSPVVVVDNCNIILEDGTYKFEQNYSKTITKDDKFDNDEQFLEVVKTLLNPQLKVRGGVYYLGVNVNRHKSTSQFQKFVNEFLGTYLPEDKLAYVKEKDGSLYKFKLDKTSKMPVFWPTLDSKGKEVLVSVVDASIHFKVGRKVIKACNNLNFDVYAGETFGLVGESGSGKTTISRAILGINPLATGGIYFKGKLISGDLTKSERMTTKKNIQMIFQDPAASLNERANIDYIVSEGLYNFHLFNTKEERIQKVSTMMREVGLLPEHLSRYPHEFSGGQRQRIGIARALVIEPELVLADEPISALDVSIRAQVLNLLKQLQNDKNLTYLFIAHDLSIIRYISDRIAVMHQGYIVELGNAEDIYTNPLHPYTRALLTAIPQPDPKTKDDRVKLVYDKGDVDYAACQWIEVKPQHYVLTTPELLEKWNIK